MFIKKLVIRESFPIDKEIRSIIFKKGMNIITNRTEVEGEKGNSLGKTTVLRVIDICLGSKYRNSLYYDAELKNTNTILEKYIHDKKVYAEMQLCDDLINTKTIVTLKVELFKRGKKYINNQVLNEKEYNTELNKILFNNFSKNPTFRQLIGMFVRIGHQEDNNRFLKFIDYNVGSEIYENIYSFLFRLNDTVQSEQVLQLKKDLKDMNSKVKQFKYFHSIKNESILKQQLLGLNLDIEHITSIMNQLINAEMYKENEQKIQQIRLKYTNMLDELDNREFKLSKLKNNLSKAEVDDNVRVEQTVLMNLYSETKYYFDALQKTFQELVDFNESIKKNKINFYREQIKIYNNKVEAKNIEIQKYFFENKNIIMLIENDQLEEYQKLEEQRNTLTVEKGRLLEVKEKYESLLNSVQDIEKKLKVVPDRFVSIDEIMQNFNKYFRDYSEKIIQEKFILYPTNTVFPIGISNEETGLSTGTKKSAITAFDLAYQNYSEDNEIVSPKFVVHDVLESMDKVGLEAILEIVNKSDYQYIVAILKDKLEQTNKVTSDDIRLTLTSDDKFFKV